MLMSRIFHMMHKIPQSGLRTCRIHQTGTKACSGSLSCGTTRPLSVTRLFVPCHRHLSTDISQRRQFKEIPVHPGILSYIETIGVGIPARRRIRNRGAVARPLRHRGRRSSSENKPQSPHWQPPPPFGPKSFPVKFVGKLESAEDRFPPNKNKIPEIALAGRSNVGKSTLLNALLYGNRDENRIERTTKRGRTPENLKLPKGFKATVSNRPGETRQITFYQLAARTTKQNGMEIDHKLRLVDLPGYGFAFASEEAAANYRSLLTTYLLQRGKYLKRVLLLIDARHGMKKADIDFLGDIQGQQHRDGIKGLLPPIQIVLTKCDLVSQSDLARRVMQVRQQLSDSLRREPSQLPVMLVSARAGVGYNNVVNNRARGGVLELQKELAGLVVPRPRSTSSPQNSKD